MTQCTVHGIMIMLYLPDGEALAEELWEEDVVVVVVGGGGAVEDMEDVIVVVVVVVAGKEILK